jgi:hypothetical protein
MILDNTSKDIILISYPSGGFGHFLYYALTELASDTAKTQLGLLEFGQSGDCHNLIKYTETYYMDPSSYSTNVDIDISNKKVLILCDNGILNDQYQQVKQIFPNATILRSVIDLSVRPVIYQTYTLKAIGHKILANDSSMHVTENWIDADEKYSQRENYTLMYHNWSFGWLPDPNAVNISIEQLILDPMHTLTLIINELGMEVTNLCKLQEITSSWLDANKKYFEVYYNAKTVMDSVKSKTNIDISHISDLHQQGYINYCLESVYNITIPVYDYRNWFLTTGQIIKAIDKLQAQ